MVTRESSWSIISHRFAWKCFEVTLEQEARQASTLVIWTDGDREGENIGYEIIQVCRDVNARLGTGHKMALPIGGHTVGPLCPVCFHL